MNNPMQRSALVFNHAHIRNINVKAYQEGRWLAAVAARVVRFLTLWSALAVVSISTALLTPYHFA